MHCYSRVMPRQYNEGDHDCFLSSFYQFTTHDDGFPRVVDVGKCLSPFIQLVSLLNFILACTYIYLCPRNADSQWKAQLDVTARQEDPTPKCCCCCYCCFYCCRHRRRRRRLKDCGLDSLVPWLTYSPVNIKREANFGYFCKFQISDIIEIRV